MVDSKTTISIELERETDAELAAAMPTYLQGHGKAAIRVAHALGEWLRHRAGVLEMPFVALPRDGEGACDDRR